jgi:hypothetical protein
LRRGAALLAGAVLAGCVGVVEGGGGAAADGGDDGASAGGCPAAPADLRLAEAVLDDAGATTFTLAWSADPRADRYRVERSDDGATWTELGATRAATFADPEPRADDARYRVTAIGSECQGVSEPVVARAVAAERYAIAGQDVATVEFTVTLGGVVRYPRSASGGPFPLVVVLHGNHGICRDGDGDYCPQVVDVGAIDNECSLSGSTTVPNAEGYDYLLETLAAQGYVAVSIDGNAFNCRTDFVPQRAQLILAHLRQWAAFASPSGAEPLGATFAGKVDLGRVGLVGHSRGGAAVSLVPAALARAPIAGVSVGSVFALAPSGHGAPQPAEAPFATLVPTCDGDVWQLEGIGIWDRVRHDARAVARSQLVLVGANHNFFNTEWLTDDNDEAETLGQPRACAAAALIGGSRQAAADAQQGVLQIAVADWFDATLRGAPWQPYLQGEAAAPAAMAAWAGAALDLRTSYVGPERQVVDDLADASTMQNLLGLPNAFLGFATSADCSSASCDESLGVCAGEGCDELGPCQGTGCDLPFRLWHSSTVSAMALAWDGAPARASFALGSRDLAGGSLSFRLTVADVDLNDPTMTDLAVEVRDTAGQVASIPVRDLAQLRRVYPVRPADDTTSNVRPPREILQTIRVPAERLAAANPLLDSGRVASVDLVAGTSGDPGGAVMITDVLISQ